MPLNVLYLIGSMMLYVEINPHNLPSMSLLVFGMAGTRRWSMDTMSWISWHEEA